MDIIPVIADSALTGILFGGESGFFTWGLLNFILVYCSSLHNHCEISFRIAQ